MTSKLPIRLLLLDVDGVLTDGRLGLMPGGQVMQFFSVHDGLAIELAQKAGLEVGFLSGRRSEVVAERGRELGVRLIVQGSTNKLEDFEKIRREKGLKVEEVAFVGDDLPDLPLLEYVGFSAAPANAAEPLKSCVDYVTRAQGGRGAVREVIEQILKASGRWEEIATPKPL